MNYIIAVCSLQVSVLVSRTEYNYYFDVQLLPFLKVLAMTQAAEIGTSGSMTYVLRFTDYDVPLIRRRDGILFMIRNV